MVCVHGKGYLFAGTSGSGKSTLSELWLCDDEAEVFTDERVIVRERKGMSFALDFCVKIASAIDAYEFAFLPDKTAVRFLRENICREG